MRYVNITLAGFKRLGFGQVKYLNLTPVSYLQLILGINGFGKSMLLKEISPLPGSKNDYYNNGYKEIEREHNNKHYLLRTTYKGSVKCSFIEKESNTELNPGGTQSVQSDLVRDIFGYTQDIHYLLHSRESFTEMSPKRRREWFIEVSNMNYDYAILIWNKLKDRYRDIQGSIKEFKKKLTQESTTILSEEEKTKLITEIASIEQEVNRYQTLLYSTQDPLSIEENKEKLDQLKQSIMDSNTQLVNRLLSFYKQVLSTHTGSLSREIISTQIEEAIKTIQDKNTHISLLSSTIDKLKQELSVIQSNTKVNPENLRQELLSIEQFLQIPLKYSHSSLDISRISSLISHLSYFLSNRPSVLDFIDETSYIALQKDLEERQNLLEKERNDLQQLRIEAQLQQEKKKQHTLNCPQCNHAFIPGYDPVKLENIMQQGKVLRESLEEKDKLLSKDKEKYLIYKESLDWLQQYRKIRNQYQDLSDLFSLLDKEQIKSGNPNSILPLQEYYKEEEILQEKQRKLKRKEEILLFLEQLKNASQKDESYFQKEIEKEETYLKTLYMERRDAEKKKMDYESILKLYQDTEAERSLLVNKLVSFDKLEESYVKKQINLDITKVINQLKIDLGEKIKLQQSLDNKLSVIQYVENEIDRLSQQESVYKILIQELSPQKGLIAEGLSQFIDIFISYMNALIKEIWSYPLEIKSPITAFEEEGNHLERDSSKESREMKDGLTFRFPMTVGLNKEDIDDVALGSSGIKEVINLAFKLTAMKSLKLEHYPLFLDEFGASFDQQHRINATNVIKRLAEERIHSQIFIVSHYESSYGSLTDCDVSLLSKGIASEGIAVPFKQVNQHLTLETGSFTEE